MNTFDNTIPAANNYPGNDQPKMLANNVSTAAWSAIDHVGYGQTNNGQHKQVNFAVDNTTQGVQTDPASVLFTAPGVASTVADLQFKNQNATYFPNFIRASGLWKGSAFVAAQGYNSTMINTGAGSYQVTMPANTVTGTNYGVVVTTYTAGGQSPSVIYTIVSATVFTIGVFASKNGSAFSTTDMSYLVFQI